MVSRLAFDTFSALVLALTALLGAYTPAFLARRDRLAGGSGRSLTYVLGNMLSAGVMVSAGFCHLLGEALRQMPRMTFPLAPFLCGAGYMLTLVADKVVAASTGHGGGCGHAGHTAMPHRGPAVDSCCAVEVLAGVDIAERGACGLGKHSSAADPTEVCGLLERTPSPGGRRDAHSSSAAAANGGLGHGYDFAPGRQAVGGGHGYAGCAAAHGEHEHISAEGVHERALSAAFNGAADGVLAELRKEGGNGGLGPGSHAHGNGHSLDRAGSGGGGGLPGRRAGLHRNSSDSLVFEVEPTCDAASDGLLLAPPSQQHHPQQPPQYGDGRGGGGAGSRSVSFLTAMLMGVALCFHSLLEGAAMGAQPTISNSLHIFIAIVSHKGLAAYALGSSIVDSQASMNRFWSVVLPFTFASPAGIFVGYVISGIAKGVGAASISALASGTFLYVAFMEVIPRELKEPTAMARKLLALLTGFCLMSLLAIWA